MLRDTGEKFNTLHNVLVRMLACGGNDFYIKSQDWLIGSERGDKGLPGIFNQVYFLTNPVLIRLQYSTTQ